MIILSNISAESFDLFGVQISLAVENTLSTLVEVGAMLKIVSAHCWRPFPNIPIDSNSSNSSMAFG